MKPCIGLDLLLLILSFIDGDSEVSLNLLLLKMPHTNHTIILSYIGIDGSVLYL